MDVTRSILEDYSPYASCQDYFRGYTLLGNDLKDVTLPMTILTAEDDPIIPISDFYDLQLNPNTDLIIHPYGGHNGFFEYTNFKLSTWYQKFLLQKFRQIESG